MKTLVRMRGLDLNRFSTLGGIWLHATALWNYPLQNSTRAPEAKKKKKKKTRVFCVLEMREAKTFMNLAARVCLCCKEQPSVLLPQETRVILFACMLCALSSQTGPQRHEVPCPRES